MARRRRRKQPVDPLRFFNEAELKAQAAALANSAILPGKQQIRRQQAEARRQAEADARMIQGFTTALAGIVGEAGGRVDKTYADATTRQQQIGQGFANQQRAQDEASANAANQLLAQQGITQQQVNPGAGSAVTYALGGMLPANLLNETGAAMSSIAHGYGAGVAGRGQQQLQMRQAQARKDQAKLDEAWQELMDKVPGLRSEIMDKLYQREISKAATATQRDYLGLAQGREAFDQQFDMAKFNADVAAAGAKSKKDRDAATAAARKARVDALESKKGPAWELAASIFKGTKVKNPKYGFTAGKNPEAPEFIVQRPNYKQAYNTLWARFGPGLMRLGPKGHDKWWKGQIDALIYTALREAGFRKAPTPQQRNRKVAPGNQKITRPGPS